MAQPTMQGKVCLITGASSGVGQATALGLARMGAHVALVSRDAKKGAAVRDALVAASGNQAIDLLQADLSSQESIRQLAQIVLATYPQLDVLINNAGGVQGKRELTADGLERTFAVNHLAYFLLTNLLLDHLKASGAARIVSVSSEAHRMTGIDFANLQGERRYSMWTAYGQSKLANILFTTELARRLQGTAVTANCVHPGFVASRFGTGGGSFWEWGIKLAAPFAISPTQGAQTSIYLASSPQVEGVSGQYFAKCRLAQTTKAAQNADDARRLWEISAQLTHLGS